MRQVFTSPRLENVEGVAELLRAEGIEVHITQARSYKGNRRRTFSYADRGGGPQPAVWVVRSEDQPRARALLRSNGLLHEQRPAGFLAPGEAPAAPAVVTAADRNRRALRIRLALLAAIAVVLVLQVLR